MNPRRKLITELVYFFFQNYIAQSRKLVSNENLLLQTLGFDVSVDHPHAHVVKCCQLVRG